MQKAIELLQQRDKKLVEIAQSVGYDSDAAFSKAFKRLLGATPGDYRRNGVKGPSRNCMIPASMKIAAADGKSG